MSTAFDHDWIVIGSGFGGSVSALRLAEKGYRVAVLECGRRFEDADFADETKDAKNYIELSDEGQLALTNGKNFAWLSAKF